ncbi:MAG TPA: hypothetical protein DDZ51_02180 [Planctomycetaceae bacterium]|nr:hypothetical protein [Planctomycetaceae bacterium]
MQSFNDWSKNHKLQELISGILPPLEDLEKMTGVEITRLYQPMLLDAARKLDIELTDDDIADIIDKASGVEEIGPHPSHYDLHM